MSSSAVIIPGRPVVHPGPAAQQRMTTVVGTTRPVHAASLVSAGPDSPSVPSPGAALTALTSVAPGEEHRLSDVLVALVEAAGADSGVVEFSAAELPRVSYCFPAAGDSVRPMLYSETHESGGVVLQGTATVGFRTAPTADAPGVEARRERWVHAHASWVDTDGVLRGGHLWPATTVRGLLTHATVWPLHGVTLVNAEDEETLLPVFTPHPSAATSDQLGDRTAVFTRVRPNEEIAEVVAALAREHDLAGGHVRGGTGSLVGAHFDDGRIIQGPATEAISLAGVLLADSAAPTLSCSLITAEAHVHAGRLATAGNIVGATYDLMLTGPAGRISS